MTDTKAQNLGPGYKITEKIIEERIKEIQREQVFDLYEDLLETIWDRILPTLGRVTMMAIMERALSLTVQHYPDIKHIQVTREGLSFTAIRQEGVDVESIPEALKELVANLIDILAMLTGDILVQQLIKELEEQQNE